MRAIVGLVAVFVAASVPAIVNAQTTEAEWAFAPRGIFADQRVILSMQLQMATEDAEATSGIALAYHDPMGHLTVDQAAEADALPLLMAAGVHDGTSAWVQPARSCRAWSDPGLEEVRDLLSAELARVWTDLGVTIAPCEAVTDAADADILVFATAPAAVDFGGHDPDGSFLTSTPMPGAVPGGGYGCPQGFGCIPSDAGGPSPADTGSLGPHEEAGRGRALAATGLLLIVVAVARLATRNTAAVRP